MDSVYTKKGDKGETSLLNGERVSKDDQRVETYGTFDEMGTLIGLARVHSVCNAGLLMWLQEKNFPLCAELAGGDPLRISGAISDSDTERMEREIDRIGKTTGKRKGFTIPANNAASGFLHQARTVARRGERCMVRAYGEGNLRDEVRRYVNRLSDLLYMLAREEEYIQELYDRVAVRLKGRTMLKGADDKEDAGMNDHVIYDMAEGLIEAGMEKAGEIGVPMVLSVVDAGGNLVAFRRMRDSLLASIDISKGKAFTAVALRQTTNELSGSVQPGAPLYGIESTNIGKIVPFGGGYPLYFEGSLIGGFGMSGGTVEEDMLCAEYAIGRVSGLEFRV